MIHNFKNWKALNEAGWDSIDDDAGDIVINGVSLDLTIVYIYDTPDCAEMSVYIKPTPKELLKIGVFSDGYSKLDEDERQILLYTKGEELSKKKMRELGVSSVRDIEDSDIYDMYESDYKASVPDPMTREEFVEIIKKWEWNMDDQGLSDIIIIPDNAKSGYGLLGNFGIIESNI